MIGSGIPAGARRARKRPGFVQLGQSLAGFGPGCPGAPRRCWSGRFGPGCPGAPRRCWIRRVRVACGSPSGQLGAQGHGSRSQRGRRTDDLTAMRPAWLAGVVAARWARQAGAGGLWFPEWPARGAGPWVEVATRAAHRRPDSDAARMAGRGRSREVGASRASRSCRRPAGAGPGAGVPPGGVGRRRARQVRALARAA